ncbi:hypothetical protein OG819_57955 [Streptomyces sp. NBC_01549]|uniref:hypothetical protein n=1 Tax=Streptomyces sp. NBC_01549 TaxID=2975874 RepID=UPI00224D7CCF|nr:hypothetical protein [Streptomyces sp. NBC_01549]MCX4598789.1 hypothetical protein [Streptomyces sp. NBC_01549]
MSAQFRRPVPELVGEGEVVPTAHGLQQLGAHGRFSGEAGRAARDGEGVACLLLLAEFGSCAGAMIVDISLGSLQTALIPHALRARVNGAYRTLTHGMRPLGALAGGALGTAIGLRPTLWIATAGTVMCLVWVLPSPVPRIRELPDSPPEPAHGAPSASASASSPSSGY